MFVDEACTLQQSLPAGRRRRFASGVRRQSSFRPPLRGLVVLPELSARTAAWFNESSTDRGTQFFTCIRNCLTALVNHRSHAEETVTNSIVTLELDVNSRLAHRLRIG